MQIFIMYLFFTISGLILMKIGGNDLSLNINSGKFQLSIGFVLIVAFFMYGVSFLIWSRIVAKNDLTYIMPISSAIINILSIISGILIFKESLSIVQIIGIIVTVIGIILINIK